MDIPRVASSERAWKRFVSNNPVPKKKKVITAERFCYEGNKVEYIIWESIRDDDNNILEDNGYIDVLKSVHEVRKKYGKINIYVNCECNGGSRCGKKTKWK